MKGLQILFMVTQNHFFCSNLTLQLSKFVGKGLDFQYFARINLVAHSVCQTDCLAPLFI